MRGKGLPGRGEEAADGITPAYAGKRFSSAGTRSWPRDHPRVCGEKAPRILSRAVYLGITPAYAGKSSPEWPRSAGTWDHPRVCGEKTQKALKYKRSFFQVLIFHLTSDRSQVSAHSLSVLDGSQSHPVPNKRILPQGNNCSVRQVSVGPASGYL